MIAYLDTSALVKLVVAEPESGALIAALSGVEVVTSALARTELHRAVARSGLRDGSNRVDDVMARVAQLVVDDEVLDRAGVLVPPEMRSLDAIHVASAIGLVDRLDVLITYDARMSAAAKGHGLSVWAPGVDLR